MIRPFGVYSMLCESLTSNHVCIIDDFLCDPVSNKLLKVNFIDSIFLKFNIDLLILAFQIDQDSVHCKLQPKRVRPR